MVRKLARNVALALCALGIAAGVVIAGLAGAGLAEVGMNRAEAAAEYPVAYPGPLSLGPGKYVMGKDLPYNGLFYIFESTEGGWEQHKTNGKDHKSPNQSPEMIPFGAKFEIKPGTRAYVFGNETRPARQPDGTYLMEDGMWYTGLDMPPGTYYLEFDETWREFPSAEMKAGVVVITKVGNMDKPRVVLVQEKNQTVTLEHSSFVSFGWCRASSVPFD